MKKLINTILIILLVLFSLTAFNTVIANDVNLQNQPVEIKEKVKKTYQEKHLKQFKKAVEKARNYAEKLFQPGDVVTLDIDETILDNREYYSIYRVFDQESWDRWVKKEQALPIQETVDFISWAKNKGYKIFLITGRFESQKQSTVNNLKKYNIYFDEIYCRPDNYNLPSMSTYKTSIRKKITDQGFKIIINIGDQKSDLKGGYGKGFKLPNPIYEIP